MHFFPIRYLIQAFWPVSDDGIRSYYRIGSPLVLTSCVLGKIKKKLKKSVLSNTVFFEQYHKRHTFTFLKINLFLKRIKESVFTSFSIYFFSFYFSIVASQFGWSINQYLFVWSPFITNVPNTRRKKHMEVRLHLFTNCC